MPLYRLKKVWKYCSYNIPFFVFISVLMFIIGLVSAYVDLYFSFMGAGLITAFISMLLTGYGLSITRDRINHGYRLPKIMPKDVFLFGIKGSIVYAIYITFQIFSKCLRRCPPTFSHARQSSPANQSGQALEVPQTRRGRWLCPRPQGRYRNCLRISRNETRPPSIWPYRRQGTR